jgi:WD repeat-containing protein 21A
LTVDPSEDFLFAAGQDRRIRAWSLQSGQAIHPTSSYSLPSSMQTSTSNPFYMEFNQPVAAMQVTNEREGMCLWAASDKKLLKYHLGQREN